MIFKNVSGGAISLPSANIIALANGNTIDLGQIVDGLPLLSRARIESDASLSLAVSSGDLIVVRGGVDLDTPASVAELTSATVGDLTERSGERVTGTLAGYVSGDTSVVASWTIPEDSQTSVVLERLMVVIPVSSGRVRGGVCSGVAQAGRDGAGAAVLVGRTLQEAENLPGDRFDFDVSGNTLRLTFRATVSPSPSDVPFVLKYSTETLVNP